MYLKPVQVAILICLAWIPVSYSQESTTSGGNMTEHLPTVHFASPKEMMWRKEYCRSLKQQIVDEIARSGQDSMSGSEQSAEFQNMYPAECLQVESFTYRNLTTQEVLQWIMVSGSDPQSVYDIARDVSLDTLRQLLSTIVEMGLGMPGSYMAPVLDAVGDIYIQRLGGIESLRADHISFLGPAVVYLMPSHVIGMLHSTVLDFMLASIGQETIKSERYYAQHQYEMPTQFPNGSFARLPFDPAATLSSLMMDIGRLKALCRATFNQYNQVLDEPTMNKTWILMWCAPARTCSSLNVNLVQNYRDALSQYIHHWNCYGGGIMNGMGLNFMKAFPQIPVCGRQIAAKAMMPGPNQLVLDSVESLMSMRSLTLCLADQYLMQGVDLVGCQMAVDGARQGIFNKNVERYIANKCLRPPADLNSLNCTYIRSGYGPMLAYLDRSFWNNLPTAVLCDSVCMDSFKEVDLPSNVRTLIMNRCFGGNVVINSQTVRDMGAMVTQLPIDKLEGVNAADLVPALANIKSEYKKERKARKQDSRSKAVARTIAKKMAASGEIANIADSEDIMKEVSLNDLRSAVTNVVADLGLNDPNKEIALTDSQNKWAMQKIMETKAATNFSAADIRAKKSLAKGFLSTDIRDMGEAHNDSAIDLAKALCEQTNWPLKPLKAINRDLIVKGLMVRNADQPMHALTEMDVSSIGCECMMHFRSTELLAMEPSICSAVCEKIGYCSNFRCLNRVQRKNVFQACLQCKGLGVNYMADSDVDELGPSLISELSGNQVSTLVPSSVLVKQIGLFKEMCMNKDLRMAISSKIVQELGSDIDMDTLTLMGSGIILFPRTILQGINASYIASLVETLVNELDPVEENAKKLQKCCQRWWTAQDHSHYEELKYNLQLTISDAVRYRLLNPSRRKRSVASWTCADMQLVSEAFTTVTDAEIQAMNDTEFVDCLADIGSLTSWSTHQKSLLLNKTEEAFGTTVCSMPSTDILNLGFIAEALSVSQINCMPLAQDDIVTSLGAISAWTPDQLAAFSQRYMSERSLTDITHFTASEVTQVGSLLCGFSTALLAGISAAVVAASGSQLGELSGCPIPQLVQLKTLAIDPAAYGPVADWTTAEVAELKFVLAGLTGAEISNLSIAAIESLDAAVIPKIPADTLKDLTVAQLQSFTDAQAVSVTADQRAAMSAAQTALLDEAATGGQEQQPEVTGPGSTGSIPSSESALIFLVSLMLMLLLSA